LWQVISAEKFFLFTSTVVLQYSDAVVVVTRMAGENDHCSRLLKFLLWTLGNQQYQSTRMKHKNGHKMAQFVWEGGPSCVTVLRKVLTTFSFFYLSSRRIASIEQLRHVLSAFLFTGTVSME